jgi:hypothetical protein
MKIFSVYGEMFRALNAGTMRLMPIFLYKGQPAPDDFGCRLKANGEITVAAAGRRRRNGDEYE